MTDLLLFFLQVASVHQNGPASLPPAARHQHPAGLRLPNHSHATVQHPTGITISHSQGHIGVHHSPAAPPGSQALHHPPVSQGSQSHPAGSVPASPTLHHSSSTARSSLGHAGPHHPPGPLPSSQGHAVFQSGAVSSHSQAHGAGLRLGVPTSQAAGPGTNNAFSTAPHPAVHGLHNAGMPTLHSAMHVASSTAASSNSHGHHPMAGVVASQSYSGGVTPYSTVVSHSTMAPHGQGHGTVSQGQGAFVPGTTISHGHTGLQHHMGVPPHGQHVRTPSPGSRGQSPHHTHPASHGPPHHPPVSSTSSQGAVQARSVEEKLAKSAPSPSVSAAPTALEALPHHPHGDRGAGSQPVSDVHNAVVANSVLSTAGTEAAGKGVLTYTVATSAVASTGGYH